MNQETIFALATPKGVSGVAVIRVSGSQAQEVLDGLTSRGQGRERELTYSAFVDPKSGDLVDRGMCVWFKGPQSFTGEDVAEFHFHGSRAVVVKLGQLLIDLGCRPAEPGEFTRRAFANGKYDLLQVEALSDLLSAETDAQRQQALHQMDGALSKIYFGWRDRLVRVLAAVEAEIDFPDEDVPEGQWRLHLPEVAGLRDEVRSHLADNRRGQVLRDGVDVVLLGPPNVGKSSLLNALTHQDVAIVSDIAGTTRDVVESRLDLNGVPVIFRDTAGLRTSSEPIEREGVRRAKAAAEAAEIRIWLTSCDTAWDAGLVELFEEARRPHDVLVVNKMDIGAPPSRSLPGNLTAFELSAASGLGLESLLAHLSDVVQEAYAFSATPALTRARHRHLLAQVACRLGELIELETLDIAVVAEHIRLALRTLGEVTGQVNVEEVLDLVFQEFCIGK